MMDVCVVCGGQFVPKAEADDACSSKCWDLMLEDPCDGCPLAGPGDQCWSDYGTCDARRRWTRKREALMKEVA